jgi:hypothetical protein
MLHKGTRIKLVFTTLASSPRPCPMLIIILLPYYYDGWLFEKNWEPGDEATRCMTLYNAII